jgi:hypothetical protein
VKSFKQVVVIVQNARREVDLRWLRRLQVSLVCGAEAPTSRLLPEGEEVVNVRPAQFMEVLRESMDLAGVETLSVAIFEEQPV